ncbi:glycosyltransferase family 8 protein [Sphingobacterium sp. SRCM116780]|uniref:glycosyltransferase family 8 protein n=1 Tax=Sphingobacterium sp. SRCM116780 TaxID=2907623 RepID=UPI001F32E2D3|nr:glycosyltransferase family 8 protein [Sphingobacterium sp. SRCM116780]UIR56008.1 glycosyltransferase family 8 protein [Sphingobacterium sp. SRCM116780]
MKIIPIVFCFDDNWEMPAGVCITSLLENANIDTFYDIFILYSSQSTFVQYDRLSALMNRYKNCKITYRSVGNQFEKAFQIRGITNSTYFRLLIPELIPEYDKIMYHDVDVIFRQDLAEIFESTDLTDFYVAGVTSPGGLNEGVKKDRLKLGLDSKDYILAGNIIFNNALLRQDGIVELFKKEVQTSQYQFQDMDIINIVCKGKTKRMAPVFCATIQIFNLAANQVKQDYYSLTELKEAEKMGIVHYNGPKPWVKYCPNFDIWWEYYRRSIFFDSKYYFDFFNDKIDEYDRLSLKKRIKILVRYFTNKGVKN